MYHLVPSPTHSFKTENICADVNLYGNQFLSLSQACMRCNVVSVKMMLAALRMKVCFTSLVIYSSYRSFDQVCERHYSLRSNTSFNHVLASPHTSDMQGKGWATMVKHDLSWLGSFPYCNRLQNSEKTEGKGKKTLFQLQGKRVSQIRARGISPYLPTPGVQQTQRYVCTAIP